MQSQHIFPQRLYGEMQEDRDAATPRDKQRGERRSARERAARTKQAVRTRSVRGRPAGPGERVAVGNGSADRRAHAVGVQLVEVERVQVEGVDVSL